MVVKKKVVKKRSEVKKVSKISVRQKIKEKSVKISKPIPVKGKQDKRQVELLKDDNIRVSLESVQYEYKNGKLTIFGADTHIVEGMVRSVWCAKNKSLNIYVY